MRNIIVVLLLTASIASAQNFCKIQRHPVPQHVVTFNGLPADLEAPPFILADRVFISLTDLLRHVDGTLLWGPNEGQITVMRHGVEITGHIHYGVRQGQTYIPLRRGAELMGLTVNWDGKTADVRW